MHHHQSIYDYLTFTSYEKCMYWRKEIIPDIAGVRMPSPITMLVPRSTTSSSRIRELWCLSKNSFSSTLPLVSLRGSWELQADISSSGAWEALKRPTFARRHSIEYKAKVPPAGMILLQESKQIADMYIYNLWINKVINMQVFREHLHHYHLLLRQI